MQDGSSTFLLMAAGEWLMHHPVWKVGCVQRQYYTQHGGLIALCLAYAHNRQCGMWLSS